MDAEDIESAQFLFLVFEHFDSCEVEQCQSCAGKLIYYHFIYQGKAGRG